MQTQGVIEHYKEHSMHYIAWMAEQINCNLEWIEIAERFYEKDISRSLNVLESMVEEEIQTMSKSRYMLSEVDCKELALSVITMKVNGCSCSEL